MKTVLLSVILVLSTTLGWAQGSIPLLGNQAPSFEANTTNGKLVFPEDFGKSWKILFSHPADFTPVCTTELLELAKMQKEFSGLNVKLAVISTDKLETNHQWIQHMEDILKTEDKHIEIEFPLIDDSKTRISNRYGMLHAWENKTRDVRGVFIIDPENTVQSISFYPLNIGRNMFEIKRLLIALQTSKNYNVYTPANWEVGGDVLMPYIPSLEADVNAESVEDQYYKIGINLWYKRGTGELIPITGETE